MQNRGGGGGGGDLNAWMVTEGWAFAYRRYSLDYVDEESRARAAKRGVWRGEVVAPWEWRKGVRLGGSRSTTRQESERCNIKGNIGKNGARIYHVPGGRGGPRTQSVPSLRVLRRRNRPVASHGTSITTKKSLGHLQESHSGLRAQRSNLPARVHHAVSAWILIQEAFDVSKPRPSLSNPNRMDCESALIGWACDQARIGGRLKAPA